MSFGRFPEAFLRRIGPNGIGAPGRTRSPNLNRSWETAAERRSSAAC